MTSPQPRQPFQNVRQRGEVDDRRTRPTVSEQYVSESKRGSEDYRGITPKKNTPRRSFRVRSIEKYRQLAREAEATTLSPQAKTVFGPALRPEAMTGKFQKLKKKIKAARLSWWLVSFLLWFFFAGVMFEIFSLIGLGIASAGAAGADFLVGWIPLGVGTWFTDNAAAPGIFIFEITHYIAVAIHLVIVFTIATAYLISGIKWYRYWPCYVMLILSVFFAVAPVLTLFPFFIFFALTVVWSIE